MEHSCEVSERKVELSSKELTVEGAARGWEDETVKGVELMLWRGV